MVNYSLSIKNTFGKCIFQRDNLSCRELALRAIDSDLQDGAKSSVYTADNFLNNITYKLDTAYDLNFLSHYSNDGLSLTGFALQVADSVVNHNDTKQLFRMFSAENHNYRSYSPADIGDVVFDISFEVTHILPPEVFNAFLQHSFSLFKSRIDNIYSITGHMHKDVNESLFKISGDRYNISIYASFDNAIKAYWWIVPAYRALINIVCSNNDWFNVLGSINTDLNYFNYLSSSPYFQYYWSVWEEEWHSMDATLILAEHGIMDGLRSEIPLLSIDSRITYAMRSKVFMNLVEQLLEFVYNIMYRAKSSGMEDFKSFVQEILNIGIVQDHTRCVDYFIATSNSLFKTQFCEIIRNWLCHVERELNVPTIQ